MLVNNENLTNIWYDGKLDLVKFVDQRLLPYELKSANTTSINKIKI